MRKKILKVQAYICLVVFLIAACCLDSESYTPMIVTAITGGWLMFFAYANNWFRR